MMRYRILSYRQGSKSAKALAEGLGGKVLKLEGSSYTPRAGDRIINWGNTNEALIGWMQFNSIATLFNAISLKAVTNKLIFFQACKDAGLSDDLPSFWENKNEIPTDQYPVVCRTVLAGHSGVGIVMADSPDSLVDASLYVKYVKKQDEYRIHVGKAPDGQATIIAQQRKARRVEVPDSDVNWQVRNHSNGFVFVRNDCNPPACVLECAKRVFLASQLDFGAVDVIYNTQKARAYALEINTAPGLEGQTITDYVTFFKTTH